MTITVRKSNKKVVPIAVAEVNQSDVKVGKPVTFTAENSTDENGEIVSYRWSEGNKTLSKDINFTYTFATEGLHRIKLTITDEEDKNATDTVDVTVFGALIRPVAIIQTDKRSILPTESVRFDGNDSYDPDGGEIISYTWRDANKTVLSHSPTFTRSFNRPGTYRISLLVMDDDEQTGQSYTTILVKESNATASSSTTAQDSDTNETTDTNTTSQENNATNPEDNNTTDENSATDSNTTGG